MICRSIVLVVGLFQLLTVSTTLGAGRLTVDEDRMRIEIGAGATLRLPVTNAAGQPISSTVQVELLDANHRSRLPLQRPITIAPGSTIVDIPLPGFLELEDTHTANYGWLRLKYAVGDDASGIVSVSRLASEPFVLAVARPYIVHSRAIRLQVFTSEPGTGKPVSSVEIAVAVSPDREGASTLTRNARTDANGLAQVEFDRSGLGSDHNVKIEVRGRIGKFVRRVTDTLSAYESFDIITTTDKPFYQPGQKLRARFLAMDAKGAIKGRPLTVTIEDSGHDDVLETNLVTSAFGEAHMEWEIPENARSGTYSIWVTYGVTRYGYAQVWIGRYDLPEFSVDVKRDRPFYLPGQEAVIDVQAKYLFGKNVTGAKVRITREISRTWNYREDKWEVEPGQSLEGVADADGRFRATLKLGAEFEEFSSRKRARFLDIDFVADVTDPSTRRTEQRRFAIRVTQYPIHLYMFTPPQAEGLPLEFYVAASYADGAPAACDVEVLQAIDDERIPLTTVRTNQYGVAKVSGMRLPGHPDRSSRELSFELRARDGAGRVGTLQDYLSVHDEVIRVYTDRVFYRPGEPIDVRVESTSASGLVVLNALRAGEIVHSVTLQLVGGKASARIPYS
jgi:hypothetical protein